MRLTGRKAFRVGGVGGGEDTSSRGNALLGQAVVHISGRQQAKPRVMVPCQAALPG